MRAEGFESPLIDYQDDATIATGLQEVLEATGGTLDALFNNGAFACPGAVEDVPTDALRAIFEANFFGWHDLSRRVIPVMRAQGHGRIVQNSSVLGLVTLPWRGAYVSTKFALEGLTDTLRIEMRGTGIEVILIEPGPVTSRIRENAIPHFERWIDWQNSARSDQYAALKHRLYDDSGKKDAFELPAVSVTKKLIHAVGITAAPCALLRDHAHLHHGHVAPVAAIACSGLGPVQELGPRPASRFPIRFSCHTV